MAVREQALRVVEAAGPGKGEALEREVRDLQRVMFDHAILSMNAVPDRIFDRAAREGWIRGSYESMRAMTRVAPLSVPLWSWLAWRDVARFRLEAFLFDVEGLWGALRQYGPGLLGYAVWLVLFASASACWFAIWASLNLLLRAVPALTSDVARLFKGFPRPEIFASGIVLAVFAAPVACGVGIAAAAVFWIALSTAYLRRGEFVIAGMAILLLVGVFLSGGFLEAIHPVAKMARQGGWLGGEGYYYQVGSGSGDERQDLLTGPEWERLARFARARAEMEGGDLRTAEALWTELIQEGEDVADAYNNRGIVRVRLGKTEEGLADFEAAAGSSPANGRAQWNAYQLYLQEFRLAQAARIQPDAWAGIRSLVPFDYRAEEMTHGELVAAPLRVGDVWRSLFTVREEWFLGGEEERGPRPVLPPRSRGMGPAVSGDRAGLDGTVETSFQEDLDEQRLPFVRGQHAGRREPGVRRHLQRVPRAGRQGAPRRGGARAAGVEYTAAPSVCPGLLRRGPGGGSPLGGEGVPVHAVRHPPLPFRRPVHHLVELRQAGGRPDRRHADRSLEGGAGSVRGSLAGRGCLGVAVVRQPPAVSQRRRGKVVAMQGKIADFSIPDIFQLVSSQAKSGSLAISGENRVTIFLFSGGRIVDVQPDRRESRSLLGTMLRDAGYLTDSELKRILSAQGVGKKIGEILVEKGKVSKEVLARYLVLQVKECLFDVLTLREGEYRFEGFAVRPVAWGGEPIRPDVLLMEGMQYLDEYPRYRDIFPSGDFQVRRKRGERVDMYALSEEERVLWKALDFSEEPDRVYRKACLTGFEGIKALSALLQRGLIEVSATEPGARVDPGQRLRDEITFRRRVDAIRMALWGAALAATAVWVYRGFLSLGAFRIFTEWIDFF